MKYVWNGVADVDQGDNSERWCFQYTQRMNLFGTILWVKSMRNIKVGICFFFRSNVIYLNAYYYIWSKNKRRWRFFAHHSCLFHPYDITFINKTFCSVCTVWLLSTVSRVVLFLVEFTMLPLFFQQYFSYFAVFIPYWTEFLVCSHSK